MQLLSILPVLNEVEIVCCICMLPFLQEVQSCVYGVTCQCLIPILARPAEFENCFWCLQVIVEAVPYSIVLLAVMQSKYGYVSREGLLKM